MSTNKNLLLWYRILAVVATFLGSIGSAEIIWNAADGIMGIMALINLIAIGLLSGIAFKLLRDYTQQRKEGRDPVFTRDKLPGVTGIHCWENERSVTGQVPQASPTVQVGSVRH
ncbi:alanine:cation symporter family protein [Lysinibacter sp. HNR]|uniref:alanine:cation symporter family protein n=1 Tax=Lysinibacter sp. HNR TaxID=3031408 RepID=UPI002434DF3F|nr:alanine:cation symporter family protein [Lysinibacter sp. HNR]WGD38674.1 alanine:cation symporter family protein [Lysinibacter sp. HNR]